MKESNKRWKFQINMESSTACNARCTFCPRYEMMRPMGEMSDELFHKIIKEGKEMGAKLYSPYMNGEPFVFPRIWEWLDYMEKEGLYVSLFTNAEFVDVERIIKYKNIRHFNCSLNAATKETHTKLMRGPRWETVTKNIDELIKKAPFSVWVSFVETEDNAHEVEAFKKMYRRRVVGKYANWTGARNPLTERAGKKVPCYPLMCQMFILWDGRIVPCCLDFDAKMVIGDANKQSLGEIWNNNKWMRSKHRKGEWDDIPMCKSCNYNVKEIK